MSEEPKEPPVRLVVIIPKNLHKKLKTYAVQNDTSLRDLVIQQIQALVGKEDE